LGSGGIAPCFTNFALGGGEWSVTVPIGQEAVWGPEPVWTWLQGEKSKPPVG